MNRDSLSGRAIMAGASFSSDATSSLVRRFATHWESDAHVPDVFDFLQRHPHASLRQKADVLLIDQKHRWRRGVGIPVEEYCARCPEVAGHHRLLLELIAAELDVLTQRGEQIDLDRFFGRFPDVRESVWSLLRQQQNQPQGAGYAEMIRQVFDEGYLASTVWGDRSENRTCLDPALAELGLPHGRADEPIEGIFLSRCPPFTALPASVLRLIESHMHERHFDSGSCLMRQGTPGAELMVLCSGTVEISTDDEEGRRHLITRTGRIQVLGEMALLSEMPRMANVTAVTAVRVLVLTAERFHELARQFPALSVVLTLLVAGRLGRPDRDDVLTHSTLSGFRIRRQLGRGGMSIVYQARDLRNDRLVALKMMSHRLVYDELALQQFQHEADIIERFEHPNIVRMLGRFRAFHTYFIVMEFCDGETLRDFIQRTGPLPAELFQRILGQVACALSYAHTVGVIHRDVKPANIMLNRDGTVKLMDFGLAQPVRDSSASEEGRLAGTPRYMAPEQVMGDKVGRQSDLFSLGLVAWEMLSGRPLILENDFLDLLRRHANWNPPDLHELAPELDADRCRLLNACLAADPEDRPESLAPLHTWAAPVHLSTPPPPLDLAD